VVEKKSPRSEAGRARRPAKQMRQPDKYGAREVNAIRPAFRRYLRYGRQLDIRREGLGVN
jgi:hypothetical protein